VRISLAPWQPSLALHFVIVDLSVKLARDALFHAEHLFDRIDCIGQAEEGRK
jgi:hypothetical protein